MVGRLIQHEEVRLDHEEASEVGSHDPTTTHLLSGAIEVGVTIPEAPQHFLGLGLDLGVVECVEFPVGLEIGRTADVAFVFELFQGGFQFLDHSRPTGCDLDDGIVADVFTFLREESGQGPFVPLDSSFVGFFFPEDDSKDGRLAGTIGADEGDALSIVHLEVGIFEQGLSSVGFLEIPDREHNEELGCSYIAESLPCATERRSSSRRRKTGQKTPCAGFAHLAKVIAISIGISISFFPWQKQ